MSYSFLQAFLQSDLEYMNKVAEQTFSSFNTGNKPSGEANPERFYHGFVLEFKVKNSRREKTLEDTLQAALAQIDDRNYDAELMARGTRKEKIRHYGFAFEGKKVLIG